MWAAVLSCALFLLHHTGANLQYSVFAPMMFKANNTQKICFTVVNAPASTPMNVYFEYQTFSSPVSIFNEDLPAGDTSKCSDFFVPSVETAGMGFLSVEVGDLRERKSLVVNGVKPFCVGDIAMPIYQAGQTVTCRVVCLDANFMPFIATVLLFEVMDPNGNRLMQQKNMNMEHFMFKFSYQLINDAVPGFYQMRIECTLDISISVNFEVKPFVLPTFETTLTAPQSVGIMDKSMIVSVAGSYTYSQSLVAGVHLTVCRKPNSWQTETCNLNENGICVSVTGNLGPDGTMNATIDLTQFQVARNGLQMSITTEAVITENGTDVQVTKTAYTWISRQMPTPYFNYQVTRSSYKKGINCTGSLTLRDNNNNALPKRIIILTVKNEKVAECTTDEDGICPFTFDTSSFVDDNIILEADYREKEECYESTNRWIRNSNPQQYFTRYYSPSGSFVQMQPIVGQQNCGQTISVLVDCSLNMTAVSLNGTAKTVFFTYMIMGRSEIKQQDKVEATLNSEGKCSFSFPVTIKSEIAPSAKVIVTLLLPTGELVADSQSFEVERCFDNQVTLEYSTYKARPGSPVDLRVSAAPNSYCAVRAVDQSMNILSGGQGQSLGDNVYNRMPYPQLWGPYIEGFVLKESDPPCINMADIIHAGLLYEAKGVSSDISVFTEFQNFGMWIISSTDSRKPIVCPKPSNCQESRLNPPPMSEAVSTSSFAKADSGLGGGAGGAVMATIRTLFPVIWKDMEVMTDSEGKVVINSALPDTITRWDTKAFCISVGKGFGVSNGSVSVIGFQQFFTELTLPAIIVREEEFVLKGTAYNYMNECTPIVLTLADSNQYTAAPVSVENKDCICENERTTQAWSFKANSRGKINISLTAETNSNNNCPGNKGSITFRDTVARTLLVESEGLKREETQSSLICTKDGQTTEPIDVKLPENVVNDSAQAFVTCIGDPMGVSLRNLGDLAQMPAGCGEQVLSTMISNLAVYNYLLSVGSLDEETKSRIQNNLNGGYARMLQFYLPSGCFSTWSRSFNSDSSSCNTWLSIMTYGTFMVAKNIGIYIDETMASQVESFIVSQQDGISGAFYSDGRSYINIANSNYSYTACAALQLQKAGYNATHPALRDAFGYLDSVSGTTDDTLGEALACNAYALAGNVEKQKALLDKLNGKATEDGNGLHLSSPEERVAPFYHSFQRPTRTGDNLLSALFLSCYLTQGALSPSDLTRAALIGKWLGGKMNANGGFSSTMDTSFSLEAMGKLQAHTFTKDAVNTVKVMFADTQVQQFTVNADNSLLLQRADLTTVPGKYSFEVTGNGCVFCQATLKYNIKPEDLESSFDLKVWTSPATCENGAVTKFDITCNISYTGKQVSSNMPVMDVKLPSGCRAVESSLQALTEKGLVPMYDTSIQSHLILYFHDMTTKTISVTFSVEQTTRVENLKPSPILVYTYYNKFDEVAVVSYTHPCSQPLIAA